MKMNLMYNVVSLLFLFLPFSNHELKEVKIGQRVPDVTIKNIINFNKSEISLSELKGKLVIFDFGNTGCAPCIKLLPEMERLQKQFGDRIQIFFVIPESKDRGEKFLATNPKVKGVKIPVITGDTVLHKLFPHYAEPFECWVDASGELKARTASEYVTEKNITAVLNRQKVDFVMQYEQAYDYTKSILRLDSSNIPEAVNANIPQKLYYSALTNYLDGVAPRISTVADSVNGTVKYSMINFPLLSIYTTLCDPQVAPNQIIIDVNDAAAHFFKRDKGSYRTVWQEKNWFCYEAVLPLLLPEHLRKKKYLADTNNFFGMTASKQKKEVECWVIRKLPNFNGSWNANVVTRKMEKQLNANSDKVYQTMNTIVGRMNWNEEGIPPTIDESGLSDKERNDFYLNGVLVETSFDAIRNNLRKYGLDLYKERRIIDVFLITDKDITKDDVTQR